MIELLEGAIKILSIVAKGIGTFIDFVINLPILIYDLIYVIPRPFNDIVMSFIGIIVTVLFMNISAKIYGAFKGG